MSCPLFLPGLPLGDFAPAGMPLGDVYGGVCAAERSSGAVPEPIGNDKLRRCCNVGYARSTCERAQDSPADAARFLVKSDRDGIVEVAWSLECNHHPVAVGTLEVAIRPITGTEDPLERQARACAVSYLRRVGRA
jgi:hypothetical protein